MHHNGAERAIIFASKSIDKGRLLNKSSLRSPELLVLVLLIALSIVASLIGFKRRFSAEARNRRVETVVDYADAVNLSLAAHQPLDYVLRHIKAAGITSLALTEDTVDSLRTEGAISIKDESAMQTTVAFSATSNSDESRLADALTHKTALSFSRTGHTLTVNAPYFEISQLGLGLDPDQVSETVRTPLHICPRLSNFPGADDQSINWTLQSVKNESAGQATTLIFSGLDVLGDRNELRATANALDSTGLRYGSVEFGKQIGDDILCRLAAADTVRVHSIGGNEMPTMDIPTAIGRFGLAARERSIRVCYIRFFIGGAAGEPNILTTNDQYIQDIRKTLTQGGLLLGAAHPYTTNPLPGKLLFVIMSLGVAAGGLLLLKQFTGLSGTPFWLVLAASVLAGMFFASRSATPIGREVLALAAAMSYPTIGLLLIRLPENKSIKLSSFSALASAIRIYLQASAATFFGVLLVIGLLADRLFMLKVYEFAGIRLAVFTPILLVALYYALGFDSLPEAAKPSERIILVRKQWNRFMSSPMHVGQVLLGIIGLAIVGIILLRSGNDPGIGVSSNELWFRALLNKLLSVRPRTKEFLFGHPLLVAGLAFAFSGRRKPFALCMLAGAIGQSSLLNTFCHIHTPLTISVLRASLGLILGGIIGSFVFLALDRFLRPDNEIKQTVE